MATGLLLTFAGVSSLSQSINQKVIVGEVLRNRGKSLCDDAAGTQECQGRDGAPASASSVLDNAPGMGLCAMDQVRFAGCSKVLHFADIVKEAAFHQLTGTGDYTEWKKR